MTPASVPPPPMREEIKGVPIGWLIAILVLWLFGSFILALLVLKAALECSG